MKLIKESGLLCWDCGRPTRLGVDEAVRKNRREIDGAVLCTRCYEKTTNMSGEELNMMKQKKELEKNRKLESFKNPNFIKQLCQIEEYMAENITYFDPDDLKVKIVDWKAGFIKGWWKGHIMLFDKRFAENSFGGKEWNIRVDLPNNFLAIIINEKEAETVAGLVNKNEAWSKINRYIIYACLPR
ncbi:MAG: hypothetical protein I3273_02460 [Candidatus Moeniiplasma glomeromycotorum]|nr:hypothetical protein [Candidatus Moeniiplasma glomeromycotorum]MCE8167020.1 hypothetical protein [Candidatus Moeniiplasma glomeromycotorum]MCE8168968.1 hypothetical protein [Candidatus Moeniiplasma glomeromycotorum]